MKMICAYCKSQIGTDGRNDGLKSHGICAICLAIENAKLDKLEVKTKAPQLLIDTFAAIKPEGK
jgi:hypothetical protein